MRTFVSTVAIVFSFLALVPRVEAQSSHAAPQAALDAAVQRHVAAAAADRETVLRLLDRPEVQAVAGEAGLDLQHAKDAVGTLDGRELATVAVQAAQVDQALAGGQSRITISTTMIIIALLVLILIIVAVD
jgi:hypothetical protein